ncbi:Senescence/dehydration-associated protein-related [Zea mays]|uniref:Senescence/dehydration-associated protein-related n=1 Tax=Zea mays TaxID=4577 RepID=A0A1D6PF38_MAIZE|nr:Senescence/dehydration-associated protein-related [Zea mays]
MAFASSNAKQSLYPDVDQSHPDLNTPFFSAPTTSTCAGAGAATGNSLYPTVDPNELAQNLFPETVEEDAAPPPPTTEEEVLAELDRVLEEYTTFSVKQVETAAKEKSEVMDARAVAEITPEEAVGDKKEVVEEKSAAFWTTIAPNVDDYSSSVARLIARGSGQLVRGIIWCGDITAGGLRRGEEVMKKSVGPSTKPTQVKPSTLRRMKRARRVTKMSNRVANSILSGVLKVTGFVTSTVLNSKPAQKFFKLMPGEVILASLDGFGKIWDAVEVSGKNVMQTSSVVTTSVVTHRYGEQAGEATHNYLHATGNVLGAAWAVFKIRKALDPKGNMKKSFVSQAAHAVAKESVARQKKK